MGPKKKQNPQTHEKNKNKKKIKSVYKKKTKPGKFFSSNALLPPPLPFAPQLRRRGRRRGGPEAGRGFARTRGARAEKGEEGVVEGVYIYM